MTFRMTFRMTLRMTFKTLRISGGYLRRTLKGTWRGSWRVSWRGTPKGTSSGQVRSRSGLIQVWFSLQNTNTTSEQVTLKESTRVTFTPTRVRPRLCKSVGQWFGGCDPDITNGPAPSSQHLLSFPRFGFVRLRVLGCQLM